MIPRDDIAIGNLTHVGKERTENQDYYGYYEPEDDREFRLKGRLVVVCDGMGGHAGGEIASRLAVNTILQEYRRDQTGNVLEALRHSVERANRVVWEKAQEEPQLHGMGSTCTAMVLKNGMAYFGHVGDSRAYLLRNGHIQQITKDHSLVQQMVDEGILDASEMEKHPDKNVILRSMGVKPEVEVDLCYRTVEDEDSFLLCSDGLSGLVADEEMNQIVHQYESNLMQACSALVDLANQRGGYDNITVQVVKVHRARLPEEEAHESTTQMFDMADVQASIDRAREEAGLPPKEDEDEPTPSANRGGAVLSAPAPGESTPAASGGRPSQASPPAKGGGGGMLLALVLLVLGLVGGIVIGLSMAGGVDQSWVELQEAKMAAVAAGGETTEHFQEAQRAEEEARAASSFFGRAFGDYDDLVSKAVGLFKDAKNAGEALKPAPTNGNGGVEETSGGPSPHSAILKGTVGELNAEYDRLRRQLRDAYPQAVARLGEADAARDEAGRKAQAGHHAEAVISLKQALNALRKVHEQAKSEKAQALLQEAQTHLGEAATSWKKVAGTQYQQAFDLVEKAKDELRRDPPNFDRLFQYLGEALSIIRVCKDLYETTELHWRQMNETLEEVQRLSGASQFAVFSDAIALGKQADEDYEAGRLFAAANRYSEARELFASVPTLSTEYAQVREVEGELQELLEGVEARRDQLKAEAGSATAEFTDGVERLRYARQQYDEAVAQLGANRLDTKRLGQIDDRLVDVRAKLESASDLFDQVQTSPPVTPEADKEKVKKLWLEAMALQQKATAEEADMLTISSGQFGTANTLLLQAQAAREQGKLEDAKKLFGQAKAAYQNAIDLATTVTSTTEYREIRTFRAEIDEVKKELKLDAQDATIMRARQFENEGIAALGKGEYELAHYKFGEALRHYREAAGQ